MSLNAVVSGIITGTGSPDYLINASRNQAVFPKLIKRESYNHGDCPIAAFEYNGFSPNKIIDLVNKHNDVRENSDIYNKVITLSKSSTDDTHFPLEYYQHDTISSGIRYLVTDTNGSDNNGIPLFYQHELMYDSYIDKDENSIHIYKNGEYKLKRNQDFIIQYSYDLLSSGNTRYGNTSWSRIDNDATIHRCRILLPLEAYDEDTYYLAKYTKTRFNDKVPTEEIVDIQTIYGSGDFNMTSSGVILTPNSTINTDKLSIIKDPTSIIKINEITAVKNQAQAGFQSDQMASWKVRLSTGAFLRETGYYYNGVADRNYYEVKNDALNITQVVTNIKPDIIKRDILKINEAPIYIDPTDYVYPNYTVPVYDKKESLLLAPSGQISIDVNGVTRTDINILSLDRNKGFIQIDKEIELTDDVEISLWLDNSNYYVIDNLELNPKVQVNDTDYHINDYPNGVGIALRPYNDTLLYYPYIYDPSIDEASRQATVLMPIGLVTPPPVNWDSDVFVPIAEISITDISSNIITMSDARKIGGGITTNNNKLKEWFDSKLEASILENIDVHESEWYVNKGYYNGSPLPFGGLIIITVPLEKITNAKEDWINHYRKSETTETDAVEKGTKEFNYYLDRYLTKYISGGSSYIITPTVSGVIDTIYNTDF